MSEGNRFCKEKCSGFVFLAQSKALGGTSFSGRHLTQGLIVPCPCQLIFGSDLTSHYQKFSRFENAYQTIGAAGFQILRPFAFVMPEHSQSGEANLLAALKGFIWKLDFFSKHQSTAELYSFLGPAVSGLELSERQEHLIANQLSIKRRMAFKSSPAHVLFSGQELSFLQELLRSRAEILRNRIVVLVVFQDEFMHLAASKGQRELLARILQLLNKEEIALVVVSQLVLWADSPQFRADSENTENGSLKDEHQKLRFRSTKQKARQQQQRSFQELLEPEVFDLFIQSLLLGFEAIKLESRKPLRIKGLEQRNDL